MKQVGEQDTGSYKLDPEHSHLIAETGGLDLVHLSPNGKHHDASGICGLEWILRNNFGIYDQQKRHPET